MSSECDCARARRELEEYVHHELCSEEAADIRAHLETCGSCREEHLVSVTLTQVISRSCREAAPEDLRRQVLLRLRQIQLEHISGAVSG
ncbi:MAG: zf-HC2 domain-containing protein [Microbacteriaceae bacterium]|jgi:anti-sigma factor (TIGR02949 family)|nr:zf-HC2 domain-containing protein [Microbacteriaceae bacterium]MCI1207701.1 zf-HC2 domain-containing protein [Microbacteriaceae bacterium]